MSKSEHQLIYFPYLGLDEGEQLTLGPMAVWSASLLDKKAKDARLRERIAELLACHRVPTSRKGKSQPLGGIGIVSRGGGEYKADTLNDTGSIDDLRYTLFLSCLANNVTLRGPNAGHSSYTAENFSLVFQHFGLESKYITEVTGVLVSVNRMGLRIGEVEFHIPGHVPAPRPFQYDQYLWKAIDLVRQIDRSFFRRLMAAASLFLESYHNSHQVDVRARVLLQLAAFEVLLDLPDRQQRRAFKDEIERLCSYPGERRYRYKYEVRGSKHPDSRTQKGIWADRFYMLRNRIIHGDPVSRSHYWYRGAQHHVMIASMFFIVALKGLVREWAEANGAKVKLYERLDWVRREAPDDGSAEEDEFDEGDEEGFRVKLDWESYLLDATIVE